MKLTDLGYKDHFEKYRAEQKLLQFEEGHFGTQGTLCGDNGKGGI